MRRTGALDALGPLARSLADLVLPQPCAGCGAASGPLCPACRNALAGRPRPCPPRPVPPGCPPPWAPARYDGAVRAALVAYKERGRTGLAGPLGAALAGAVLAARDGAGGPRAGPGGPSVTLVPVPSARAAVRRRGHDPARLLLAAALAELRRQGVRARGLRVLAHARRVGDQAGLGAAARWDNLSGALAVPARWASRLAGERLLVVDDVVTTGATLAEAARALRRAGAEVPAAAVVAATPRRPGRRDGARAARTGPAGPPDTPGVPPTEIGEEISKRAADHTP